MQEQSPPTGTQTEVPLNCLGGRPAPPVVAEGWKQLSAFPRSSWQPFWLLLAPVLLNPSGAANKELTALFCKQHDISPEGMLAAMGCCEMLLKQSAALDLPDDLFQKDLAALTGGNPDELVRFIGERFPEAKRELRNQIFEESLSAHGKVMTGLEWRLDTVRHSSKGNGLNTDVVLLTLQFQEGRKQDRITLQLTKGAARQLKRFCDRLDDDSGREQGLPDR